MTPRTAILVAGMHRSGTSALAGALNLLGVPLGNRLLEPGPDNPKGYWEHRDIVSIHERLLAALGSRWDDVRALPANWLSGGPARRAADAITQIVERDFSEQPLWAVKDPRLCRFLPLWIRVLQGLGIRPAILFMLRDPAEVSASIVARNQWLPPFGEILWLRYVTEALRDSAPFPRTAVTYDALLADPGAAARAALPRLGISLPVRTAGERKALAGFVDAADRHHTQAGGNPSASGFAMAADGVYQALRKVAEGGTDWAPAERAALAFEREWQDRHALLDAFGGMAVKLNCDLGDAEIQIARLDSDLRAQIDWSKQAQADKETLQAENAELSSKLTAQVRWSQQAQADKEALQAENAELSSRLTAQIRWSEGAQADRERLTAELARSQAEAADAQKALTAKLEQTVEASERLAAELERSRTESANVTNALKANLEAAGDQHARLARALEQATSEKTALAAAIESVYASRSWRYTRPLRAIPRLFSRRPEA